MTPTWSGVLDDFEALLGRAEAALAPDAEGPMEPPFVAPVMAGPLPPDLTARAQTLVRRAAELETRADARRQAIRDDLERLPRTRPTAASAGESRFETYA